MRGAILVCAFLVTVHAGFFSKKAVLVRSVRYKECPGYNGFITLRDARVSTTETGDLIVSGGAATAVNITSPVQAELSVSRRLVGVWVPVPCISGIGSCTYSDLCSYGLEESRTCPGALDENDVPCRCPILQGLYSLPGAQFPIPTTRLAGLLAGNYKAQVKFTSNHRLLACYLLSVQLL